MNSSRKQRLFTYTLLNLLLLGYGQVIAQELDSHVHGEAQLNVALFGQQLQLEFISPAINLLGIEREPISAEEKALVEQVSKALESSSWLIGSAYESCRETAEVFELPAHAEPNEHPHAGDSHGDIHVQYLFDCPTAPANQINITAFANFDGIEEIAVQWITESRQGLANLTANNSEFTLE